MKNTPYTQNMDPYAENTDTTGIDSSDYLIGAQINKCIPAKWWNTLFGSLIRRVRQSRNDFNAIYQEFLNVLSEAGITPDEEESDQLLQALAAIRDAQPLATHNSPGYVKSAGGKVNVSVNPSTGEMTAVGVGDIFSSVSGITTNPSVQDIISALTFLSVNISGSQLVIPPKPETWTLHRYSVGKRGASVYEEFELEPGWYRVCVWGATGGKGGSGGSGRWRTELNAYNTQTQYDSGSASGSAGSNGTAGQQWMQDIYYPVKTKFQVLAGGGGVNGNAGGSASGSSYSSMSSGSGASAAAAVVLSNTDYALLCTRLPPFTRPSSSPGSGGSGSRQTKSVTASMAGVYAGAAGGGGGSGGSCGCGTIIKVGKSIITCSGGAGGDGGNGGTAVKTISLSGSGSQTATGSGGGGGRGGTDTWSAQARLPIIFSADNTGNKWSSPDGTLPEMADTNNRVWLAPITFEDSGTTGGSGTSQWTDVNIYFNSDPERDSQTGYIVTPINFQTKTLGGTIRVYGNTEYIGYLRPSVNDGLPGGIAIFEGANI